MKKSISTLLLTLVYLTVYAQVSVSGKVIDEFNVGIENVVVFDSIDYRSAMTDSEGQFEINIDKKINQLFFQHVSYVDRSIKLNGNTPLTITLVSHQLSEVVIKAISNFQNKRSGEISINKAIVDVLPTIGGEIDYIKSLVLFPGVSNGEEISKGMTVRGGSIDQNLSHINGVQTSNSGHLFNTFSAVPAIGVEQIQFFKGGIPAHFGNALASSMDITLRKPEQLALNVELGVTNSKFSFENTFGKQKKSSFLFSLRTSYIDAFRKKSKRETLNNLNPYGFDSFGPSLHFGYSFYDLFGTVNLDLGKGISFDAFGLYSYDINTYIHNKRYITHLKHDLINSTYGFTLAKQWNNHKIKITGGANENQIKRIERTLDFNNQKILVEDSGLLHQYGVKNWTSKLDYSYIHKKIKLQAGLFSYFKKYKPSDGYFNSYTYNPILQSANYDTTVSESEIFKFSLLGAYIESDFSLGRLGIHAGIRLSQFVTSPKSLYAWEPRLSLEYQLSKKTNLKGSFDYLTQFDHGLVLSEAGLDNLIFVPSFEHILPAKSRGYSLGITHQFWERKLHVSTVLFYRNLWNLQKLALEGKDNIISESLTDLIAGNGIGKSYGLEFQATFQQSIYLLNLSYTYGRSTRVFEKFNNDKIFNFNYDKPHELNLSGAIGIGEKSSFSFNFIMTNGARYTLPSGILNSTFGSKPTLLYDGYQNEAQLPLYHRMDIGYDYKFIISKKWNAKIKFNIINLFNRRNINFIEINPSSNHNYKIEGISYFPLLPSINLNIRYE